MSEMAKWATSELLFILGYITADERHAGLDTAGVVREGNMIVLPTVLVERASS